MLDSGDSEYILAIADELKEEIIRLQRSNTGQALFAADVLMELAEASGEAEIQALALRMKAQCVMIGKGNFQESLEYFDQAIALYRDLSNDIGLAEVEITRIYALAHTGNYEKAIKAANAAQKVFKKAGEWRSLASLLNNLASIQVKEGFPHEALEAIDQAINGYFQLGDTGRPFLTNTLINRMLVECDLGQFQKAIDTGHEALSIAEEFQQSVLATKAIHNLGITFHMFGKYAQALSFFERAESDWIREGRIYEVFACNRAAVECLLSLGRYREVLAKCSEMRRLQIDEHGHSQKAFITFYETEAYLGLGRFDDAENSIALAEIEITEEDGSRAAALFDIFRSGVYLLLGQYDNAYSIGIQASHKLTEEGSAAEAQLGILNAARAAEALGDHDRAGKLADEILSGKFGPERYEISFDAYSLLAKSAGLAGDHTTEREFLLNAIERVEYLQKSTMVEHRSDLLLDDRKQAPFQALVRHCFEHSKPYLAFDVIERAKSRALRDLIEGKVTVRVKPRSDLDVAPVNQLNKLRSRRNAFLRRMTRMGEPLSNDERGFLGNLEAQILDHWHRLLLHVSEYAEDATSLDVWHESTRLDLPEDSVFVNYFRVKGGYISALLTRAENERGYDVALYEMPFSKKALHSILDSFQLNIDTAASTGEKGAQPLISNARSILENLYAILIAPIRSVLDQKKQLVIIPHGILHYLPFHAFHDGNSFLIDSFEISYLPSSGLFRPDRTNPDHSSKCLAVGYSHENWLPYVTEEARSVNRIWGGSLLEGREATTSSFKRHGPEYDLVHLAAHGRFRPDQPMFSGMEFADQWLIALDIFDLDLKASLVTLSACSTGRSIVGGGDELLGLTRGFLASGARSLLMSHWAVNDRATAIFFEHFYQALKSGQTKRVALQAAQRLFIEDRAYSHPFYWAPFFLVGETGKI